MLLNETQVKHLLWQWNRSAKVTSGMQGLQLFELSTTRCLILDEIAYLAVTKITNFKQRSAAIVQ